MTTVQKMTVAEVEAALKAVKPATKPGETEDGTRVHVHYKSFGEPTPRAIAEAARADELGLHKDRYTGRVSRVWKSKAGDLLLTLFVELERLQTWRTFNINRGEIYRLVVLGN